MYQVYFSWVSSKILSRDRTESGFKDSILLVYYMKKFNNVWCIGVLEHS